MKTKIILLLFLMTAINSLPAVAQAKVEQFSQPYPAGEPLVNNPNFIGQAYLHPLTSVESLNTPMFNVTFEPGCRNSWHSHSGGQLLIATAGIGYYQERGKAARRLYPGDIVEIAPDVEHWHGAAPDRWFAHIAIECNPGANKSLGFVLSMMRTILARHKPQQMPVNRTTGRWTNASKPLWLLPLLPAKVNSADCAEL